MFNVEIDGGEVQFYSQILDLSLECRCEVNQGFFGCMGMEVGCQVSLCDAKSKSRG